MPLLFNELVFDEVVYGTTTVYTDPKWNARLGMADRITMHAQCSEVSGTNPTLTVGIEMSGDNRNFGDLGSGHEINAAALTANQQNQFVGANQLAATAVLAYVRLAITLGGTSNPQTRVRLWVTGRTGI